MSEKRWPNCETADDWVAELDRRMDADPNVELAPVAVGIMRTTQIIHEAMQAAEERGRRSGVEERDELRRELWHAQAKIRDLEVCVQRFRSLAPRGSATRPCKHCGSSEPHHHTVLEPRDSGKDLEWPEDGT